MEVFLRLLVLLAWLTGAMVWPAGARADSFDDGDAAFHKGDYARAVTFYTAAIKARPQEPFAYNNRGLAYHQLKKYSEAMADFNTAIRLKTHWIFYYNRGLTNSARDQPDAAISDYSRALRMDLPDTRARADCLLARAHAYFNQEKSEPAMADLNKAIKLGMKDPDAYVLRGILHKVAHNYAQSLADYEKAIALGPKEARAWSAAAYLMSVCPAPKYRDGGKAVRYATTACELTEWRRAQEIETLAAAYAEMGDFEQAIKFHQQAEALDPKEVDAERLALYRQKQPVRDLNRKDKAVPLPPSGTVSIKLGEKLHVHFEVDGELLVNPTSKKGDGELEPNSFALNFYREKGQRVLRLDHSFPRTVRVKCLARLHDWDAYFETDLLPIPPNQINPELWSEPIDELVLFDWYFSSDTGEESVASNF